MLDAAASADFSVSEPRLRNEARAAACRHEKRVSDLLREVELRLGSALQEWIAASEARADDYTGASARFLTGEHHAMLGALLAATEHLARVRSFLENPCVTSIRRKKKSTLSRAFLGFPRLSGTSRWTTRRCALFRLAIP
jgi:hypothetical protein